jgi:hypothetical protein
LEPREPANNLIGDPWRGRAISRVIPASGKVRPASAMVRGDQMHYEVGHITGNLPFVRIHKLAERPELVAVAAGDWSHRSAGLA